MPPIEHIAAAAPEVGASGETMDGSLPKRRVVRAMRKDGRAYWCEVRLAVIRSSDGAATHNVFTLTDVTAAQHAEQLHHAARIPAGAPHDLQPDFVGVAAQRGQLVQQLHLRRHDAGILELLAGRDEFVPGLRGLQARLGAGRRERRGDA